MATQKTLDRIAALEKQYGSLWNAYQAAKINYHTYYRLKDISLKPVKSTGHIVVMITTDEDGYHIPVDERKWCLSVEWGGSPMAACDGQVYGYGEGATKYKTKDMTRGGVTCPDCLAIIKFYKQLNVDVK